MYSNINFVNAQLFRKFCSFYPDRKKSKKAETHTERFFVFNTTSGLGFLCFKSLYEFSFQYLKKVYPKIEILLFPMKDNLLF